MLLLLRSRFVSNKAEIRFDQGTPSSVSASITANPSLPQTEAQLATSPLEAEESGLKWTSTPILPTGILDRYHGLCEVYFCC